jgi:nicotinamide-nucleotide amidase
MNPRLEIFSQGDEVVTGQIADTNAAWLAQQAVQLGFTVTRHTAVGDNLSDLIDLLKEIAGRADCCFCTGGLGPTTDDLTAEAVSKAFNLPLVLDEIALAEIEYYFICRERPMPESNRKQALLPQDSERLDNECGTAPGFALKIKRCWFVFMPGVPLEMQTMYLNHVQPQLTQRFCLQPNTLVTLRTAGIGESAIQKLLNTLSFPKTVQVGFRATTSEVQIKLLFPFAYSEQEKIVLTHQVAALLGDHMFVIDEGTADNNLVSVINQLMTKSNQRLAVLETISCGLLASLCVGMGWLISAQYEPHLLSDNLKTLATALQHTSGASCVLVQRYEQKKSTVLHNGLLTEQGFYTSKQIIAGSLPQQQQLAAISALDLLRRYLQHKL